MQTAKGLCLAIACATGITATHSQAESQILEEIIVTAQRRAQAENTVGIAMTVFGDEAIDELRIENSLDVSMYTPGFTITNAGGASVPVYTLRGVGFDDHQPNSSATVGVYSDEVALPYPIMTMGLRHDLERIEVLKGPQGDLYGRNNTGGALNYISNGPTDIASAGISLGAANYQTLDVNGFANGPLGDRVNGRLAGAAKSRNKGWQENELTDQAVGAYDEYSLRGMLDITASDTVDIFVNLHGGRYKGDPQVPQSTVVLPSSNQTAAFLNSIGLYPIASLDPLMVADQDDPQATRWNQDPYHKTTHVGGSVIVDWKIGYARLTSITGYDEFERDVNLDWDGTPARLLEVSAETQIDSFTQEVRLASDDQGPLTWLGGLYFSKDTVDDASAYDDSESPTVGFTFGSQADQSTEAAAAFGHTQWQFARQFKLNLGARYTSETRSIENCTTDTGDGTAAGALMTFQALGMLTLTNPQALVPGGCVHLEGTGTSSNPPAPDVRVPGMHADQIETDKVTGKVGLDWLPSDDWLVYGSISSGFKSGGYNMFSALVVDQFEPYEEEELTAFEVGFKGHLLNRRLEMTGAVFNYDYENKQVSTFIPDQLGIFPGLVGIQNVPESRITGLELGANWLVTEGLMLVVNTSFLDSEIKDYDTAFDVFNQQIFDARGNSLPNAPEVSYQLMGVYERPVFGSMLVRATLGYTYQDETYSQIADIEQFRIDAYGLLDARITLQAQSGQWSVSLWGKNLADEQYWFSNALAQDNIVRYTGMPRTIGLVFDYNLN